MGKITKDKIRISIPCENHGIPYLVCKTRNEPRHEKTFMTYANNKGADQPAHLHSLISPFIVRCLDSIIYLLSKCKISRL